ncbi:MAG: energy transducer TonB [bacterium]
MRFAGTLQNMVVYSLLLHLFLIGIATVTFKKHYSLYVPKALSVKIVSRTGREAAKEAPQEKAGKKDEKTSSGVKSDVAPSKDTKGAPSGKPGEQKVTREDMQMLDDTMQLIRAKKRVEEIAKLRSIVDISTRGVAEKAQRKAGAGAGEKTAEGQSTGEGATGGIFDEYIDTISQQIRREWIYPELLMKEGLEAVISVYIEEDGEIRIMGVEKTSQDALFDRSVIRAITKASPVKRPPYAMPLGLRFRP